MIIKKISDDQVKILIESADINRYKIPYHRLSIQDEESVEFIYHLLFLVYDETGISFLENAVSIEARPATGGNYFITICRKEEQEGVFLQKEGENTGDIYIYSPQQARDIRGLLSQFESHQALLPAESSLYRLAQAYYIIFAFSPQQAEHKDFTKLKLQLAEYALPCQNPSELEGQLRERGELICPQMLPIH